MAFISTVLVLSMLPWYGTLAHQIHQSFKVFNVKEYGAIADAKIDNSIAFSKTWENACNRNGKSAILIPNGVYGLDSILFLGPCKGSILFILNGVLKPPTHTKSSDSWINFRDVDWLHLTGQGTIDGEGFKVWDQGNNRRNGLNGLPVSLKLDFVNNSRISYIKSVNSRNAHISLYGCENLEITKVSITAPWNSPNTDGIKIGASNSIKIWSTGIGTGDDCIAIISGSRDVDIWDVRCGPGHGISVGSLGQFGGAGRPEGDVVTGVRVRNTLFVGTENGVRIKTWGSPVAGLASNFTYQDIRMVDVGNPIVIDQEYCPYPPCTKIPSHIQVKDITYRNIWGTSTTKVAVAFKCSGHFPCRNVVTSNINLAHHGVGGPATSLCSNVIGAHSGVQNPPPCL